MTRPNSHQLLESIRQSMEQSELLNTLASVSQWGQDQLSLVLGVATRTLDDDEIQQLRTQGNRARDWSRLEVGPEFTADHISGNHFLGRVVLGHFSGEPAEFAVGTSLPTGVYDSTLKDCEIGDEALIHRVGLISGTLVSPHASIVGTDSVTGGDETFYGCDLTLPPGLEVCRSRLGVFAELNSTVLGELLRWFDDDDFRVDYESLLEQYVIEATGRWTIVDEAAVIHDSGRVAGSYVGRAAEIRGAQTIDNSCVISDMEQPTSVTDGACLYGSIVQWGAAVNTHSVVTDSVIGESATIEHHATISESYIGANSHIGQAEVTASLLGPFVAAHHQSLLIAATWPEGRGNIGSGAQVGSNHTGRTADQGIRCGEGLFFGLGCLVKFPTDFTSAPHTVIAAGVTTLPGRLEFPFSLINTPTAALDLTQELPAGLNQLTPAWVLRHSLYQVFRNDEKHRQRDRAKHDTLSIDALSPPTIQLMQTAVERLESVDEQPIYTEADITGLGKNFLTRPALTDAVDTYRFHITGFALHAVKRRLEAAGLTAAAPQAADCLAADPDDSDWTFVLQLLDQPNNTPDIPAMLEQLRVTRRTMAERVERSKQKDDERAAKVFDEPPVASTPAAKDAMVRLTWEQFEQLSSEIDSLLE